MEPVDLRESPAGSGDPEVVEWREETLGEDAEAKGREPNDKEINEDGAEMMLKGKGTCDGEELIEKEKKGELHSPYEEELDPRIQEELEHLNEASAEINQLELHLDEARSGYRRILTDSARKLNAHSSQLGTCIEKARPYYEARRLAKEAQQETQKAALSYERAVSMHTAAREMVYVAEQGLMADGRNTLDPTWQEMLNHATSKVNEAEEERLRSEREHMRVTHSCQTAEARVQTLQKSLKRAIVKSKPYFELKAQFNYILEEHKSKVMELEEHVAKVKNRYSVALRNLEQISEAIHAQRDHAKGGATAACCGRSPPIGAESDGGACVTGGGLRGGEAVETDRVEGSGAADHTDRLVETCREKEGREKEGREKEGREKEGGRERPETHGERAGSDSLSVLSLQTIASDLQKCDSIGHLGDLSDVGSLPGEDSEEREEGAGGRIRERSDGQMERQQQFLKQHHRSFSL